MCDLPFGKSLPSKSFLREQAEVLQSGKGHALHPPSTAMGITCLFYLLPALAWYHVGYIRMAALLTMVTCLSTLADGFQLQNSLVRVLDRTAATVAVVASIYYNSLHGAIPSLLCAAAVISSCWLLKQSRSVSRHRPEDHQSWVWYHGLWHVYGAGILAAITLYSHRSEVNNADGVLATLATPEGITAVAFVVGSTLAWVAPSAV